MNLEIIFICDAHWHPFIIIIIIYPLKSVKVALRKKKSIEKNGKFDLKSIRQLSFYPRCRCHFRCCVASSDRHTNVNEDSTLQHVLNENQIFLRRHLMT